MRLINVHTHEMREFADLPRYAILSHRWTDNEGNYKQFAKKSDTTSAGYQKVVQFCDYVKSNGYNYIKESIQDISWAWVDTCCIDKHSSVELSEAINSMYRWYARAAYCVVYLNDVCGQEAGRKRVLEDFRRSEWFTRGWTLQKLLAPGYILFCTEKWETFGYKTYGHKDTEILQSIEKTTGIPEAWVSTPIMIRHACFAVKMSWASKRKTTREEDMACCLLGLLDINMPLLYGEGGVKAFLRLQQEFIRQCDDESIFAWDTSLTKTDRNWSIDSRPITNLLALVPSCFLNSGDIVKSWPGTPEYISRSPYAITNEGLYLKAEAVKVPFDDPSNEQDVRQES